VSNFPYIVDFTILLLGLFTIGYIVINRVSRWGKWRGEEEVNIIEI
jgi:hypothetical protein